MSITIKDVEHVAKLARLNLTENEKVTYAGQLSRIIDHFNELSAVDTSGIEPMSHALPISSVLREDKVVAPLGREIFLAGAPESENGFFKVPKIGE